MLLVLFVVYVFVFLCMFLSLCREHLFASRAEPRRVMPRERALAAKYGQQEHITYTRARAHLQRAMSCCVRAPYYDRRCRGTSALLTVAADPQNRTRGVGGLDWSNLWGDRGLMGWIAPRKRGIPHQLVWLRIPCPADS